MRCHSHVCKLLSLLTVTIFISLFHTLCTYKLNIAERSINIGLPESRYTEVHTYAVNFLYVISIAFSHKGIVQLTFP